jgi:hypothetical protein
VNAVPATAHANGSRYQGETEMKYRHAAMAAREVNTARHAFPWSSSKTCHEKRESEHYRLNGKYIKCNHIK